MPRVRLMTEEAPPGARSGSVKCCLLQREFDSPAPSEEARRGAVWSCIGEADTTVPLELTGTSLVQSVRDPVSRDKVDSNGEDSTQYTDADLCSPHTCMYACAHTYPETTTN